MPEILWNSFVEFITSFVNMLIALWMVPVIVAGQLLTNTFVYGKFLWFDKTLWHIWNISKIFANYTIGFIFIYSIFKYFFATKEWDFNMIKSTLPKIVLATLVVNMSWFIVWFLVDLSTLMIASLWNLPSVFIEDNPKIHKEVTLPKKIVISLWNKKKKVIEKSWIQTIKVEDLLDWENSATGPLFYLGNNVIQINDLAIQDAAGEKKIENISPLFLVKVLVVLAFMIPIIILIIINLIRIFRIWLYIAFAPLIALDIVFGSKIWNKHPDNQAFMIWNLLWMIFQPVLVVGALSLSIIMIAGIQNAFTNPNDPTLEDARKEFGMKDFWPTSSTVADPYLKLDTMLVIWWKEKLKNSWWPMWWFLMTFLSIFVVWALVKASFKFSKIAGNVGTKMMDFTKDLAKAAPIPGSWLTLWSLQFAGRKLEAFPESVVDKQSSHLTKQIDKIFWWNIIRDITNTKYKNYSNQLNLLHQEEKNFANFKKILKEQKIVTGKDLEMTPRIGEIYKKLLQVITENWKSRKLLGKLNSVKFSEWKLKQLYKLDTDKFIKNLEVQELLDIIIKQ